MSFVLKSELRVDESLRKELARPFGKVVTAGGIRSAVPYRSRIYAIGDVTVATLLKLGYRPKISVFDYRTERGKINFPIIRKVYAKPAVVDNERGVLSPALWKAIQKASVSKMRNGILVRGEEDLASLACIHFAKKGTIVMYGLRNVGIAVIKVDSKMKGYVSRVLKRMSDIS